eukprot:2707872-Pleurochrysis_carterae.AAC.1
MLTHAHLLVHRFARPHKRAQTTDKDARTNELWARTRASTHACMHESTRTYARLPSTRAFLAHARLNQRASTPTERLISTMIPPSPLAYTEARRVRFALLARPTFKHQSRERRCHSRSINTPKGARQFGLSAEAQPKQRMCGLR